MAEKGACSAEGEDGQAPQGGLGIEPGTLRLMVEGAAMSCATLVDEFANEFVWIMSWHQIDF